MTTPITLDSDLLAQATTYAAQLNLSVDEFVAQAVQKQIAALQPKPQDQRRIQQGDIYWLTLEGMIPHPHLVLQENVFNNSRLNSVIVCALTTNLKRVSIPGTLLLDEGEADLPKQSLVEMTKLSAVEKSQLGEYIGTLNNMRIRQIFYLLRFLQTSLFDEK